MWQSDLRNVLINQYAPTRVLLSAHVQERIALWTWALPFEWMAALYGYPDAGDVVITGIRWLTKGSLSSVAAAPPPDAVGVIHSHHMLECYFSTTDVAGVATPVNLVAARAPADAAVVLRAMVAVETFPIPAINVALRVYAQGYVVPEHIPVPERARRIAARLVPRFAPRFTNHFPLYAYDDGYTR